MKMKHLHEKTTSRQYVSLRLCHRLCVALQVASLQTQLAHERERSKKLQANNAECEELLMQQDARLEQLQATITQLQVRSYVV